MIKFEKKFSLNQLITNNNGKSSLSGFCGFLIVSTGVIAFMCAIVAFFMKFPLILEFLNVIVLYTTVGAGLLGVRKMKKDSPETGESELST